MNGTVNSFIVGPSLRAIAEEGSWWTECPDCPGFSAAADTYDELYRLVKEFHEGPWATHTSWTLIGVFVALEGSPGERDPATPVTPEHEAQIVGWRCWFGLHDFSWATHPHSAPFSFWDDQWLECARGCGARKVRRCYREDHWTERHPDFPR